MKALRVGFRMNFVVKLIHDFGVTKNKIPDLASTDLADTQIVMISTLSEHTRTLNRQT